MSMTVPEPGSGAHLPDWRSEAIRLSNLITAALAEPLWEDMERVLRGDLVRERELCPAGCGCRKGTDDADSRECACDGPCCFDNAWGPAPVSVTADTDPALDLYRDEITFLRANAKELGLEPGPKPGGIPDLTDDEITAYLNAIREMRE